MEHYYTGLLAGAFIGWIAGQFWQAFQDRKLLELMRRQTPHCEAPSEAPHCEAASEEAPSEALCMENGRDEITQVFEEELNSREMVFCSKDVSAACFPSRQGGGYLSNNDLERRKQTMSRSNEVEVIQSFENIIGMNYYRASYIVKEKGYTLHPVRINNNSKTPAEVYSKFVLGVSVRDPEYDQKTEEPSLSSVVTEIIDVGGQDRHNRGKVVYQTDTV